MLDLHSVEPPLHFDNSSGLSCPVPECDIVWPNKTLNEEHRSTQSCEPTPNDALVSDFTMSGIDLSPHDRKLLRKLRAIYGRDVTAAWLAKLPAETFRRNRSVGEAYVARFIDLQNRVRQVLVVAGEPSLDMGAATSEPHHGAEMTDFDAAGAVSSSDYRIATSQLERHHQKVLRKLAKVFGTSLEQISIPWLLSLNAADLRTVNGFGDTYMDAYLDLKHRIEGDLHTFEKSIDSPPVSSRQSVVDRVVDDTVDTVGQSSEPLAPAELELALVQDFERLLFQLDERSRSIALARWGYHGPRLTLKEIGNDLGITRERVRQIVDGTNRSIPNNLRLAPQAVWESIEHYLGHDLQTVFPNLARCFNSPWLLCEFLEYCCRVAKGRIKETQCFEQTDVRVLDEFFAQTPSPVSEQACCDELMSGYGMSEHLARNTLRRLAQHGHIRITGEGVFPGKLKMRDAVAHVLAGHSSGLPWKDVARLVNARRCASVTLSEIRQNYAFHKNVLIYLCAHGTYRHVKFLRRSQRDVTVMIEGVRDYLRDHDLRSANLPVIHHRLKKTLDVDYYTLRYCVSTHGEAEGLYFVGHSSVDTVSFEAEADRVTLSDAILHILQSAPGPLTLDEVARQMRSKSYPLTAMHVQALRKAGKVARVDRRMYTTVERAFDGVEGEAIAAIIDDCLRKSSVPVDVDVLRELINGGLQLGYSKYFYNALAGTLARDYGWHIRRTLFSLEPIAYDGLHDLFHSYFDPALGIEENLQRIRSQVLVSDHVVANVFRPWLHAAYPEPSLDPLDC